MDACFASKHQQDHQTSINYHKNSAVVCYVQANLTYVFSLANYHCSHLVLESLYMQILISSISGSGAENSWLNKVHSNMNNVFPVMPITTEMRHFLFWGDGRDETSLNMKQLCTFPRIITGYPGFSVLAYCYRMLYCFADLVLRMQETHCTTVLTCFRDYFERFSLNMSDRLWALSMVFLWSRIRGEVCHLCTSSTKWNSKNNVSKQATKNLLPSFPTHFQLTPCKLSH